MPSLGNTFRGTIIENSLNDKKILENLQIKKTHRLEDWLLHDVTVSEEQIGKLGQYLDDGPWYMHFWQGGKDDVVVVFKDKTFKLKYSDKSTWTKAVDYGKSIGISEEQLDFSIK